jgi:hypothetical protein
VLISSLVTASLAGTALAQTPAPDVSYLEQGWSDADRTTFYSTGQGSHIMPYAWFKALRQKDVDAPFDADQLSRYGYIRNDNPANTIGLPIGFVIDTTVKPPQIGMTCAACHTGQAEYKAPDGVTHAIRLDGAPAASDFQQFLADLRDAADVTLAKPDRLAAFTKQVQATPGNSTAQFASWVQQFDQFMKLSLPTLPWGPGRLDAFGMIFNRVSARDIGVIGNFKIADAPVSYPFLWNAHRQDHTQWNGGVPNGLFITAMARNSGEVFGVFADFKPSIRIRGLGAVPTVINYRSNSVRYTGLQTLEEKVAALKPPPWPTQFKAPDPQLVAKGQQLFDAKCGGCHNEKPSLAGPDAWITPISAVGTDPKMAVNAESMSNPGIYAHSLLPPPSIGKTFATCDASTGPNCASDVELLASTVVGALLDDAFNKATLLARDKLATSGVLQAINKDLTSIWPGKSTQDLTDPKVDHVAELTTIIRSKLSNMYKNPVKAAQGAAYESRVLHGVWATAPYLHNGSVPNLWELLTPPAKRKATFMVGSRLYDQTNVGFATDVSPFKAGTFTVDPATGNGNGGHDIGTDLTDDEKWQIIEYMKTL